MKTWTLLHKLVNKYDDHVASLGPEVGLQVRGEYEGFYLPSLSYVSLHSQKTHTFTKCSTCVTGRSDGDYD